jgi:hypothetical protein
MPIQFIQDIHIEEPGQDALGMLEFVQTIEDALQATQPPFVYGLIGDWGCGKTSTMKLLCQRMDSALRARKSRLAESVFVPIWFNPWMYENEASVVYPLLHAIQKDFTNRLGDQPSPELKRRFSRVVKGAFIALADLGLRATTHYFLGEKMTLEEAGKALALSEQDESAALLEKVMHKWADEVGELKAVFAALLSGYAEELAHALDITADQVRFVICLDDLDRCLPQTVIQILESIKNFLTVRNTIFVLGMNAKVVAQGIRSKYPGQDVDGREYLEKIVNYSFYVPAPELPVLEKFCQDLLQSILPQEQGNRTPSRATFSSEFATILKDGRFNNPRKIKRILNRYRLLLTQHRGDLDSASHKSLVRLLVISEYFPQLFSLLLASADEVMSDLYNGGKGVDIQKFEEKWHIPIMPVYRQLITMKDLFRPEIQGIKLGVYVQAVFAITHSL